MARFVVRLHLFRSLAVSFITLLVVSTAPAQITNVTGDQAPPIEGAGHDYIRMLNETLNPATGFVSIRMGVPTPPSRGLKVPFSFGYDSNNALHFTPDSWKDNSGYVGQQGWSYLLPQLSWGENAITNVNLQGQVTSVCIFYLDYMLKDLAGGSHPLGLFVLQPLNTGLCTSYANAPPGAQTWNTLTGADSFVQSTTSPMYNQASQYPPPATVASSDGTVYHFTGVYVTRQGSASSTSQLPDWIEDRNGNKTTISAQTNGVFTITDTLGRTALSSSGFGTSGNTITVSGLTNPYQMTWGSSSATTPTNLPFAWINGPAGCSITGSLNPTFSSVGGVTQLTLPNGQPYKFQYDPATSMLSKLTYPGGGYVRYVWGANVYSDSLSWLGNKQSDGTIPNCSARYSTYAVQKRYVSFDGAHEVLEQDFSYTTTWNGASWTQKTTTVTNKDLVRGANSNTVYTYAPVPIPKQPGDPVATGSGATPVETQIQYSDTNGSLLRTVQKSYVDPQLPPDETVTLDNGKTSKVHNVYITRQSGTSCTSLCNLAVLSDKYEYDYGSGLPGALLRQTHIDYASFAYIPIFPSAASILDRPSDVITYDGNSNKVAETDYAYDQTVTSSTSATGHDDNNYPSGSGIVRGNATTKTVKCLQTGCSDAVTKYGYDQTGQVASKIDPCGNATCSAMTGTTHTTTYSYADSYTVLSGGQNVGYTPSGNTNAYLTKITDPLGYTANFTYDFNNGQLTKSTDANSQSTTYIYNDPLARPTQANYPDGGQTEATYNDVAPSPSVTTCQLISGTAGAACSSSSPPAGWNTALASMDGLGHVVQTKLVSDPDGATFTATSYDGLGKTYQAWNPTRCSPPTTNCGTETTWGFTTYLYDALGRTKQVTKPDGSVATTSYSGNSTTVSDEVGNQRTSVTDGLGRPTDVFEAPNVSGRNYQSHYQYDALGNLLCAVQKGTDTTAFTSCASSPATWRPRSFVYDSLSRLTSATNPESGTITYTYDANSNLATAVAPQAGQTGTGKTTQTYSYDVLNRLTQHAHLNPGTGTEKYAYDGGTLTSCTQNPPTLTSPTNLIGRRSAMCGGQSGSSWSFDPMGRPLLESRINHGTAQKQLNVSYTYNKDGSPKTLTYPSGGILTYTVGGAGRVTQLSDAANNYVGHPGSPATYAPQGSLAAMTNGYTSTFAGIVTSNTYNDRLQPILLSASVSSTPIFSLCYDFHLGVAVGSPCNINAYATGDNGNVFRVLNNVDSTRNAVYAYDPLNRISQANTVNTSGPNCWGEVYTIDAWGNLTNRAGVTGMGGCSTEPLNAAPASTKNQLTGPLYDAAGNVTNDGLGNTPTYDPENRIATVAGVTYSYDADGARIEKSPGTMYWPGPGGEYLAETDLAGTINEEYVYFSGARIARVDRPSGVVHYYFSDHLGSASVITDASGNAQEANYYYPYGGLQSSTGSDPNHYKFTGKERDSESNLDNFGARYFASTTGRFMTPDWAARPATVPYAVFGDPQSLNLYTYVRNDPVTTADADGHVDCRARGQGTGICVSEGPDPEGSDEKAARQQQNQNTAQNKSWWQKALSYFYVKTGNGKCCIGLKDIKVGPVKVDILARANGKDVKQTTEGKTVTTVNSEVGVKLQVGPFKVGLERTDSQEDGKPRQVEWLPIFAGGKFEGSNAEVGVGAGGCLLLCGQIEVGIQADKVLGDIGNALTPHPTASDFAHYGGDDPEQ